MLIKYTHTKAHTNASNSISFVVEMIEIHT